MQSQDEAGVTSVSDDEPFDDPEEQRVLFAAIDSFAYVCFTMLTNGE